MIFFAKRPKSVKTYEKSIATFVSTHSVYTDKPNKQIIKTRHVGPTGNPIKRIHQYDTVMNNSPVAHLITYYFTI